MKKFFLSFLFIIFFITILVGQKTVTGVVVDEIGIPLPEIISALEDILRNLVIISFISSLVGF